MSSNSVCYHTRDQQIGLPLRGRSILLITRMITDRIRLHSVLLPIPICSALYGNYRQGLNNLFSWFLFGWPRCFFVVWAQSCCMLAHLLTMFLVQIHNISALLLIYNKNGLINTTLNNHFETKFKGRDTTQSTPQKKKKKTDILPTGILALAHSKWPAKEVEINQHLQNPQKKVTSDRTTSCIYLTGSSKKF